MAQRRMFSMKIVDTDAFMDMPPSSQLLYFHLAMRADDDGFVAGPKKIMRMVGSPEDDFKVLVGKKFIIPFESGVCVIKHWLIHNYIQSDRHTPTQWIKEKEQLLIDENTSKYSLKGECIQVVSKVDTQDRLGKDRLGKVNRDIGQKTQDFIKDVEAITQGQGNLEEIKKFCSYWTEPNKSKTKLRWELQPTFDIGRRLGNWMGNASKFNNKRKITTL